MKINKITSILCFVSAVVFAALFLLLDSLPDSVSSILSNTFTGFFVSLIIALAGYFYEKHKIISKTKDNLTSLYINLNVLHKVTGSVLVKINKANNLYALRFNNITSFAALNVELINDMEIESYCGFYVKSDIAKLFNELKEFKGKMYNLKNVSSETEILSLETDLLLKEIQIAQSNGQQISSAILSGLDYIKNTLNIKTAKLHEYEASLKLELDNIIERFYKSQKYKESWQTKKAAVLKEAEDMVKKI